MITKRTIKLVNSLAYARDRRETGLFVAEGTKCVLDVLPHFTFVAIFCGRIVAGCKRSRYSGRCGSHAGATRGELPDDDTPCMATPRL